MSARGGQPRPATLTGREAPDPITDAKRFAFDNTPRIAGLAHTAPKYDSVTQPTTAPVPAACVANHGCDKCRCYSQQRTSLDMPLMICLNIVDKGYFVDFAPERNRPREQERTQSSVSVLDAQERLPISGASTLMCGRIAPLRWQRAMVGPGREGRGHGKAA